MAKSPQVFKDKPAGRHEQQGVRSVVNPKDRDGQGTERKLRCVECRAMVTEPSARASQGGSHSHTFCNPHGVVFHIGCFSRAPGAMVYGPSSTEFSWFAGYAWRLALCGACGLHLGWHFVPGEGVPFYGLILDRLIETEG